MLNLTEVTLIKSNNMFENKLYEDIYYSRFIASYIKACRQANVPCKRYEFKKWLEALIINGKSIPAEVISEIDDLFDNGKMELESHAYKWLKGEL